MATAMLIVQVLQPSKRVDKVLCILLMHFHIPLVSWFLSQRQAGALGSNLYSLLNGCSTLRSLEGDTLWRICSRPVHHDLFSFPTKLLMAAGVLRD